MSKAAPGHSFIRPQLRNQPNMGVFRVDPDLHRLQWNENPFDFPADLKEEVLQRLARTTWSRYPLGLRAYDVIDAIAHATSLNSDQVLVGSGSGDILRVVISAVLQPGDHMLTLSPTFYSYTNHARQNGAEVHTVTLDPHQNFALHVATVLDQAAEHNAKLIVICAPNNPTGTVFPPQQLRQIVLESQAFVLIDAAYAEFCHQDLRPLLAESDRVVMAHTLSKAYALAGVRIGYALGAPEVIKQLQKLVVNFTLSPFSSNAAIVALENRERFQPLLEKIVVERERMAAALAHLPEVTVYPSGTNFLLVDIGHSSKDALNYLRDHHRILLADMGMYPGYENYLRISVGTAEQNDLLLNGLAHYLATVVT
jgi:histidinol-phosphate aminotransferase